MREAIGGGWLFTIVIVFIFLFLGFLTYSISYTRAFNVKNEIINYIEYAEGFSKYIDTTGAKNSVKDLTDAELSEEKSVEAKAYYLIKQIGYDFISSTDEDQNKLSRTCATRADEGSVAVEGGYCVLKRCPDPNNPYSNTSYKVTTFVGFELKVLGINFYIPISGETRTIYVDNGSMNCAGYEGLEG